MRQHRRNSRIKLGTVVLAAAAVAGGVWAYGKIKHDAIIRYNLETTGYPDEVLDIGGKTPSELRRERGQELGRFGSF